MTIESILKGAAYKMPETKENSEMRKPNYLNRILLHLIGNYQKSNLRKTLNLKGSPVCVYQQNGLYSCSEYAIEKLSGNNTEKAVYQITARTFGESLVPIKYEAKELTDLIERASKKELNKIIIEGIKRNLKKCKIYRKIIKEEGEKIALPFIPYIGFAASSGCGKISKINRIAKDQFGDAYGCCLAMLGMGIFLALEYYIEDIYHKGIGQLANDVGNFGRGLFSIFTLPTSIRDWSYWKGKIDYYDTIGSLKLGGTSSDDKAALNNAAILSRRVDIQMTGGCLGTASIIALSYYLYKNNPQFFLIPLAALGITNGLDVIRQKIR